MKVPPVKILFPEEDRQAILAKIDQILVSGQLTLGSYGRQFEEDFAAYIGSPYAVAVNSGTSAIEIPLRIFEVSGKEVLIPTNTFFATPASVLHAGGSVRFVDADPTTFGVTLDQLKARYTANTVGVVVVHVAGIVSPEMPAIQAWCREHNLFLFEDAAHAHGSSFDGQMAGTFGDAASFSFYPTKVITSGEGGMIVTAAEHLYQEALIYRDQGKAGFLTNFHTRLGYNWRMSELHAILGLAQLKRLESFMADRQAIAKIYEQGLLQMAGITPILLPAGCRSNYYKYLAMLDEGIERTALKKLLRQEYDIGLSGEVYDVPCHQQPIFAEWSAGSFPQAEDICTRHICLPIFPTMTQEQAEYILSSLAEALSQL